MTDWRAAGEILRATLWRRRGSLGVYAGIAAAFHFITGFALPLVGGRQSVESLLKSYSPAIRELLKVTPALEAGYSLEAHFALTWLHPFFIGLCAAFVVGRAAESLAGEIESGAVYLCLSRPVPRSALLLGRLGEIGAGLALILLLSWLGLLIGAQFAGEAELPVSGYLLLLITAWCLFMAIAVVALIASSLASRAGIAAAIGTIWALASYVLDILPPVAASAPGWLNPWHHYYPPAIVAGQADWPGLLLLLGWVVAGTIVAALCFERRDLA